MRDLVLQRRREPLDLRLPVGDQRGRHDEQTGAGLALLFQGEQQGDDLNGLAQAHVVGQAGAQAELRQEVQPAQAAVLVGPQLGAQPRRAGDLPRLV